jgi:DNA-directed RNA polymerase subunit RPC12/RpoP
MAKDKIKHKDVECPECAKKQRHTHLVENDGKLECKECRYSRILLYR